MGLIQKFTTGNLNNAGEKYIMTPKKEAGRGIIIENVLDFSKVPVAGADVVEALKIPANSFVLLTGVYVITGEGATCTCEIGDGTDPNGWKASANLETTGTSNIGLVADVYGALGGKFYTVDDTIDLTMGHNTDAAKVCAWALIYPIGTDLA